MRGFNYRTQFATRTGIQWNGAGNGMPSPETLRGAGGVEAAGNGSVVREVKGVGYRVRCVDSVGMASKGGIRVGFDVGTSASLHYDLPAWVGATVDPTATKRTLTPIPSHSMAPIGIVAIREAMGNVAHGMTRLRPRSAYTGNGILWVGKAYRPLKSTKTSKK